MNVYLGIDVGSVSTNLVIIDEHKKVLAKIYKRTAGKPIAVVQDSLREIMATLPNELKVAGVGTTGSARQLISVMVGADIVKNEITAHAVASTDLVEGVHTIIEIGGQDSKIIILSNGIVVDFAMNSVCAAGTGSFLDQQASRLGIPIEDFGGIALLAQNPVRIAGRCSVFAESDMIHKQQLGHKLNDIIAGLCEALVRNYLNNVGKGKLIQEPVAFQGGVAANLGIKAAFEKALQKEIIIPELFDVMGAYGAALLAKDQASRQQTKFKGFELINEKFTTGSFECSGCPNSCEIVEFKENNKIIGRWGDRCGKWEVMI